MAAGEGIETVLSVRCLLPSMPMIAALSSAHLAAILFPKTLRRLYVLRDNDPAGERASATLIDRATAEGIEAIVLTPAAWRFQRRSAPLRRKEVAGGDQRPTRASGR